MQSIKAHILKIDNPISNEYAKTCSDSCDKIGLSWTYFNGYHKMDGRMAFGKTGIKNLPTSEYRYTENVSAADKAMCCTAGHFSIWKNIADGLEDVGIVLEHDALMLQPLTIDIPENRIVVLGYKVSDPQKYNHVKAGPPQQIIDIIGHEGAHAYAITKKTARYLIDELERQGIYSAVDNDYFLVKQRRTSVPLSIASPTPAIGWLRQSTIWNNSAARNYPFIPSFHENYK
jgi:GR25 family glycosyltransferase involved in LPS biosynthesis